MKAGRRQAAERRGRRAEALAALFLRLKGYRVVASRYRSPAGEIDLVVRRGKRIAFVEVKERASAETAAWSITPRQQQRIARAAAHWLAGKAPAGDYETGFDVVLVAPWKWPRHVRNAFRI